MEPQAKNYQLAFKEKICCGWELIKNFSRKQLIKVFLKDEFTLNLYKTWHIFCCTFKQQESLISRNFPFRWRSHITRVTEWSKRNSWGNRLQCSSYSGKILACPIEIYSIALIEFGPWPESLPGMRLDFQAPLAHLKCWFFRCHTLRLPL